MVDYADVVHTDERDPLATFAVARLDIALLFGRTD